MKSYASICSFEGEYARLEVEMHEIEESKSISAREKETRMLDVSLDVFPDNDVEFYEGDIIIVEHDMEFVTKILEKDEDEKKRRIERIKKLKLIRLRKKHGNLS